MARTPASEHDPTAAALTRPDWKALAYLYATDGHAIHDADLAVHSQREPRLFEGLSRLVNLELVDYDRQERAYYLNFDGFALVEGHAEEQAETVVAIKALRARQPAYQYTLGSLRWLLIGIVAIAGLAVLTEGSRSEPPRRAATYTALDSATWVLIREELSRVRDSVSAGGQAVE